MTTFPNMGITLPTRGAPGSGAWGDTDDANWAKVDAHDHSSGKGLPIPVTGLNINADLPFSSLWAPTQLHRVQFSAIAAGGLTAGQRTSLFVSDGTSGLVTNELYWHNSAGNKVQITSGNTLNFAAFVGGIGGDYTSVGATLNYVDAQKAYEFREGTGDSNRWARLRSGDLRLFPFNGAGSIFVGQAAPAAIAGSYTMTWPLALPGAAGTLAQIDSTGQFTFGNTGLQAITLAANQSVTASGTGTFKHGNQQIVIPASAGMSNGATFSAANGTNWLATSGGNKVYYPISLPVGRRVIQIDIFYNRAGGTLTFDFNRSTLAAVTVTTVATTTDAASSGPTSKSLSSINHTVLSTEQYYLAATSGNASDVFYAVVVTYDFP